MAEAASQALTTSNAAGGGGAGMAAQNPLNKYIGEQALRQLGLLLGLALAIAAGIGLFMWAQEPEYRPLFGQLEQSEAGTVMDALQAAGVSYKLDEASGMIMVPAGQVHATRLRLAGEGLPASGGLGFELLQQDQGFGTSQFIQNARFFRALETELARSVSQLQSVRSARVHLAVPEQSVFVRDRREPRASVVVDLHGGRSLTDGQVSSIVHLVASSVADMPRKNVTVVDQHGVLLTEEAQGLGAGSDKQLDYKEQLEQRYARRIVALLEPIVGAGRVRAQVNAQLDFSQRESTQELYDPENPVLRSEQVNEQRNREGEEGGVPGALANQPPQAGVLGADRQTTQAGQETSSSVSATRNFEISKTVRHVRESLGGVQRLSVAVLLDQPLVVNDEGEQVPEPFPQAQLEQFSTLVRDAVGFDEERGDRVSVIDAPFKEVVAEESAPLETPLLEQPWVWTLGKMLLAAVLGLVLILAVVRPLVYGLLGRDGKGRRVERQPATPTSDPGGVDTQALLKQERERLALEDQSKKQEHEDVIQAARDVVGQEPALAANVVKNWLSE
ncbi:flagellar basal-body MS-ring/collar protein FliF [Alkalilimnicola sp. S0819]|uniref:flagellar basal-body MS-ring/collar protein FliF n=1 Tax=Alkalilimnicola sp. S0819 TaxID=2613922 RepID=UPI001261DD76|nr:flagellar basal-body MS-ring/collar protein FliF [Alkalilimnicola sp. S0819]KAB7627182.1 flagellar basal body M-ring protein FliF [Alkalilimnicola sp. S0819]MPQ15894.1 flagellar basal body M-ring protein FliF [Alkalilimnicola sp. S0819]